MFRYNKNAREAAKKKLPFDESPTKIGQLSPITKRSPLKNVFSPKRTLRSTPAAQGMSPNSGQRLRRTGRITVNRDAQRFDITKMNTAEVNDLLDGVDANGKDEALQKKQDNIEKTKSENKIQEKIADLQNIYKQAHQTNTGNPGVHEAGGGESDRIEESSKSATSKAEGQDIQQVHIESESRSENVVSVNTTKGKKDNTWLNLKCNGEDKLMPNNSDHNLEDPFHDENLQTDSVLDATMPLFESQMTQTNEVLIPPCSCNRCSALLRDFFSVMVTHKMLCAGNKVSVEATSSVSQVEFSTSTPNRSADHTDTLKKSTDGDEEEKLVVLVRHCPQVKIPLSKKVAISVEVSDGDPQKLVHYLLDCLFSIEQLAGMTCDGKTENSVPLDKDIARVLEIYVNNKYNSETFNFNNKLFKHYVNTKCHKARQYIWKHKPELIGKTVRPKLQKNVRKDTGDNQQNKKKSVTYKASRFKESPRKEQHRRDNHAGKVKRSVKPEANDRLRNVSGKKRDKEEKKGKRRHTDSETSDTEQVKKKNKSHTDKTSYNSDDGDRRKNTKNDKLDERDKKGCSQNKKRDYHDNEYVGNVDGETSDTEQMKKKNKSRSDKTSYDSDDGDRRKNTKNDKLDERDKKGSSQNKKRDYHDDGYDGNKRMRKNTEENQIERSHKRRRENSSTDNNDKRMNDKKKGEPDFGHQERGRHETERNDRGNSLKKNKRVQETENECDVEESSYKKSRESTDFDRGRKGKDMEVRKLKDKRNNFHEMEIEKKDRRKESESTRDQAATSRPTTGQKQPKSSILLEYDRLSNTKEVEEESDSHSEESEESQQSEFSEEGESSSSEN